MTAKGELSTQRIASLIATYRDGLMENTLPFWIPRCVDQEYGGFLIARDRDGSLLDTDKGMWQQGRFTWLLAHLYNTVEPREQWLELATHGIKFIRRHGFDSDGRMFFQVTREGKPLRKRRYIFTEAFAAAAFATYAQAANDQQASEEAAKLFELMYQYATIPELSVPKYYVETRTMKSIAVPMIVIVTAQILRDSLQDERYSHYIDKAIIEIRDHFMNPSFEAVMEVVDSDGGFIDHFDGRILCPGHAIEVAWFIMQEAQRRNNDVELVKMGTTILDWMWRAGWDHQHGGILYYVDVKGLPVQEYWHDMKFWWPHNETIIATLLAYQLTYDRKYLRWHQLVHDWAYQHFPDPKFGEWYGYLHRDGRISNHMKGNLWKGPFHLPRMQLKCWQILTSLIMKSSDKS